MILYVTRVTETAGGLCNLIKSQWGCVWGVRVHVWALGHTTFKCCQQWVQDNRSKCFCLICQRDLEVICDSDMRNRRGRDVCVCVGGGVRGFKRVKWGGYGRPSCCNLWPFGTLQGLPEATSNAPCMGAPQCHREKERIREWTRVHLYTVLSIKVVLWVTL